MELYFIGFVAIFLSLRHARFVLVLAELTHILTHKFEKYAGS